MPEPFSSTALGLYFGYAAFNFRRQNTAISHEGRSAGQAVATAMQKAESSVALFGSKASAISKLDIIAQECSVDDWDSYGASAINADALENAKDFIRTLPSELPLPEAGPEPDGSISFDWIHSRHRMFSVSVGMNDRLAFAWLDGTDKGHGVARFDGTSACDRIVSELKPFIRNGKS
jgi:hypothetical protein